MAVRVVAVDPGKTTGVAAWSDSANFASVLEGSWLAMLDTVVTAIKYQTVDVVVCEEYRISAGTLKKARQHEAIEGIGVLRYACAKGRIPLVLQTPSDAMSFVTNDKLKALGPEWYARGMEHGRDAVRHLVLYLVRQKLLDPARLVC